MKLAKLSRTCAILFLGFSTLAVGWHLPLIQDGHTQYWTLLASKLLIWTSEVCLSISMNSKSSWRSIRLTWCVLSETWLNSTWSDTELHIDGYNITRRDRDDSQRGGGTAIYYSTKFTARQRSDLFIQDIETVWLELTLPNRKKTLICALYKPPNADFDAFKASLDNVLEQSASEGVETLVLGDFNCDMLP